MPHFERPLGGVPQATEPLLGRALLFAEVLEMVQASPLVTLVGPGGVGKTRLAIEVAHQLAPEFADGVRMVEFASVADAASVPDVIAGSLGVLPHGDGTVLHAVAESLAGRQMLLVVDNCEHVAVAAAQAMERILSRAPSCRVLATSRERLGVAGEQRVTVDPLRLDGGVSSDASTLFVERARAVRRGFSVEDDATATAVTAICDALDGLPLAIEMAAARMASMTPLELRNRLHDRFRLLVGAEHRPLRHRTLENVVAWSYDMLDDADRRVLLAAAVFVGGVDPASLAEILDESDEVAVLVRLDSLVNKSFVVADQRGGTTRYRVLDTIRRFAELRLAEQGALDEWRDRHAEQFARYAALQWASWNGPGWRSSCDWVETELANLRAAYRWSADKGSIDVAVDVAAHAALMGVSVQLFETIGWAEELVPAATAADVARLPRLCTAAGYACFAGRPVSAVTHAHRAVELAADGRYDPCEPGLAEFVEALASVYSGDLNRYVALSDLVAHLPGSARAYGLPALVDGLQASGRVDEALALTGESVAAALELGNPFWITYSLWTAGLAEASTDQRRALAAWDEGVSVAREHRARFFEGFLARDAARVHALHGDPVAALALFDTAIDVFQQAGNIAQLIVTVASVPLLLELLGEQAAALTLLAAVTREPASMHHVRELATAGPRLEAALGAERAAECIAAGATLDLHAAASYARRQLERLGSARAESGVTELPAGLSRREADVLRLLSEGLTTREIAATLFIAVKTADRHIQNIYVKIGVSNRAAATRWAHDRGLVASTPSGLPES